MSLDQNSPANTLHRTAIALSVAALFIAMFAGVLSMYTLFQQRHARPSMPDQAQAPSMQEAYPPLSLSSLKNATYTFDSDVVTLQDGVSHIDKGTFPDGEHMDASISKTAFGDLNGDGSIDAAVVIQASYGGSGDYTRVIPVLNNKGMAESRNPAFPIGDRIELRDLSISNGIVRVKYVTQGPNDALCCPTKLVTIKLVLQGKALKCADRACLLTTAPNRSR